MRRFFLRISDFWKSLFQKQELTTISRKKTAANFNEPSFEKAPKIILTSADDESLSQLGSLSYFNKKTNRELIVERLQLEPSAYNSFTAIQLYVWLDKKLTLQAISKTLYKMKIYGLVEAVERGSDKRAIVWRLLPKK